MGTPQYICVFMHICYTSKLVITVTSFIRTKKKEIKTLVINHMLSSNYLKEKNLKVRWVPCTVQLYEGFHMSKRFLGSTSLRPSYIIGIFVMCLKQYMAPYCPIVCYQTGFQHVSFWVIKIWRMSWMCGVGIGVWHVSNIGKNHFEVSVVHRLYWRRWN